MNKIAFIISATILVLLMKATGAIGSENVIILPGEESSTYTVYFGHSLEEKKITSFVVFINDKTYTGEMKTNDQGRLYAEIPNRHSAGERIQVYAVINYKDGSSFQTSQKIMTSTNGFGSFVFAKI